MKFSSNRRQWLVSGSLDSSPTAEIDAGMVER